MVCVTKHVSVQHVSNVPGPAVAWRTPPFPPASSCTLARQQLWRKSAVAVCSASKWSTSTSSRSASPAGHTRHNGIHRVGGGAFVACGVDSSDAQPQTRRPQTEEKMQTQKRQHPEGDHSRLSSDRHRHEKSACSTPPDDELGVLWKCGWCDALGHRKTGTYSHGIVCIMEHRCCVSCRRERPSLEGPPWALRSCVLSRSCGAKASALDRSDTSPSCCHLS